MIRRRILALLLCSVSVCVSCAQETVSSKEVRKRAEAGVKALQQWYVPSTGLYKTTGWWNSANAITAITNYMRLSGDKKYRGVLKTTFAQAQIEVPKERQKLLQTDGKEMTGFPG